MTESSDRPLAKKPVKLLMLAAAIGISTLAAAWLGWRWADSPRLDLAQWLPAAASVATLVAATFAAVFAAGAFRLESDRESQWVKAKEREQADQIACWVESISQFVRINEQVPIKARTRAQVNLRNQSNQPIYEPSLLVYVHQQNTDGEFGGQMVLLDDVPPVLPPGHEQTLRLKPFIHELLDQAAAEEARAAKNAPTGNVGLRLKFRDVQGQWWLRDQQGYLHPASSTDS